MAQSRISYSMRYGRDIMAGRVSALAGGASDLTASQSQERHRSQRVLPSFLDGRLDIADAAPARAITPTENHGRRTGIGCFTRWALLRIAAKSDSRTGLAM